MAVSRDKLAEALAYEQAKRQRLAEYIPTVAGPQSAPSQNLRTDLENLSAGLGQGIVNQLEGVKGLITDPIGTAKGAYEAVRGIVRDPKVLAQALAETGRKAMSGPLGAGEVIGEMLGPMRGKPTMAELDVYHGSPHRFEEFDASKIGTGEGAQAYGHGIYLAESPAVAEQYRKVLGEQQNPYKANVAMSRMSALIDEFGGDLEKAADRFMQSVYDTPKAKAKMRQGLVEEFKSYSPRGQLYKADLPDEMVDRMLDWDKPLSEQPAAVRKALKDAYNADWLGDESKQTGQNLYKRMGRMHGDDIAAVSNDLREIGIPGIKYLDAGSRGQGGSGTRNFVVFPGEEKKVKILKRE